MSFNNEIYKMPDHDHPILAWMWRTGLKGMLWVFILSAQWDGRTLFSYAHNTLVQNTIVQAIEDEASDAWSRIALGVYTSHPHNPPND